MNRHASAAAQCLLVVCAALAAAPAGAEPDWDWMDGITLSPTGVPLPPGQSTATIMSSSEAMLAVQYGITSVSYGGTFGHMIVVEREVMVDGQPQLQTLTMHWAGDRYLSNAGHQLVPCTPNASTGCDTSGNHVAHFVFQEPDGNGHSGHIRANP